ncbi:MAG TPA: MBL fold metallo-hydrolase [Actinomycetota bacterium]|nr:MBL fold metallo-hydrolase [Actinomycetota bacterium]
MVTDAIALVAPGITAIDTVMAGERELNAVYLVAAAEPCLVETGPGADHERVVAALDRLGVSAADLAHLVVTHIHMDHAGGVGALLERYPRARVWVHEAGARHLVEPERLVASTARTYGQERMHLLYGDMIASPADRVRAVADGDAIELGDRRLAVIHTPGHASHHIALHDDASGAMFTGEAIGSYLPWATCFRPALPPPEVDLEAAYGSLRRMRERRPASLLTSHFGAVPDPPAAFDAAGEGIHAWAQDVRTHLVSDADAPLDAIASILTERARREFEQASGRAFEQARYDVLGSIRMNAQGLSRYWRKRWEREMAHRD